MPGWLFMTKMNANTIWESWEGTEALGGIASLDHYSKGAVLEWVFSRMCGINVSGERKFTLAPKVGGKFTFASLEYESIYGKVTSGWKRDDKKITYAFHIPTNTSAEVVLPNMKKVLPAGDYEFVIEEEKHEE